MGLTSRISLQVSAVLQAALDLETPGSDLTYRKILDLADGSGLNQANKKWSDQRTLALSANEDLDLSGVLVNALGVAITFTRIVAVIIVAAAGNANTVKVKPAAVNGFVTPFNAATDTVVIRPGGLLVLVAPDATGYVVTAATGDLLNIANGGAGTSVTYDIILIGS